MIRRVMILSVVMSLTWSAAPCAQDRGPSATRGSRTALWTGIGAGAGFGVGLWAGLTVFDDAVNSDRKVWTTAIGSAVAGAVVAHLLTRPRAKSTARPSRPAPQATAPGWPSAAVFNPSVPALGSGAWRDWRALRAARRGEKSGY